MNSFFALNKSEDYFMNCFLNLLLEKSIDKISINELCKKTHYNRSTFYYYFSDIHDLNYKTQLKLINTIIKKIRLSPILTSKDFVTSLLDVYNTYGKIIIILNQQFDFYYEYKLVLKPIVLSYLNNNNVKIKTTNFNLTYNFVMGGIFSLLDNYYRHPNISIDDLTYFIQEQISKFIYID